MHYSSARPVPLVRRIAGMVALIFSCSFPAIAGPTSTKPSIEELFRAADLALTSLSPNGRQLAAIQTDEHDFRRLLLINLTDGNASRLGGEQTYEVYNFHWLTDDRLIFDVSRGKQYSFGLYAVNPASLHDSHPINLYDVTRVVGRPRARPHHVILWITKAAAHDGADGGLVEIDTGRSLVDIENSIDFERSVVRTYPSPPTGAVVGWSANFDGELAYALTLDRGVPRVQLYRAKSNDWQPIDLDLETHTVLDPDADGRRLWVASHDAELGYVIRPYDPATAKFGEPVHRDPTYDLATARLFFSEQEHRLVGVRYYQQRLHNVWFSKTFMDAQATIDEANPTADNALVDFDDAERRFLYLTSGPRQPDAYLLYDSTNKSIVRAVQSAPWLNDKTLAGTRSLEFKTRDGVKLEGYLTLPAGTSKDSRPALVVLPHGGPWVRNVLTFDPEVQFLASCGYAVLQPNYRGSAGYAPAISAERRYDFLCMHNDVTDAARAMQRSGLIDPRRVAIMGGSFGGYLALAGVAFEPDLYRCAVSLCGIFDWEEFIKGRRWDGSPGQYDRLRTKLGQPDKDHAYLDEISPLGHADKISVPVFIAHGLDDTIVDAAQSKRLAAVLKTRGVPHETFFRPLEGHGFYNYQNRVEYYHRVEAFLAANLGAPSPTPVK